MFISSSLFLGFEGVSAVGKARPPWETAICPEQVGRAGMSPSTPPTRHSRLVGPAHFSLGTCPVLPQANQELGGRCWGGSDWRPDQAPIPREEVPGGTLTEHKRQSVQVEGRNWGGGSTHLCPTCAQREVQPGAGHSQSGQENQPALFAAYPGMGLPLRSQLGPLSHGCVASQPPAPLRTSVPSSGQ